MPNEPEEWGMNSSWAARFLPAPAHVTQMMLCWADFVNSQSSVDVFLFFFCNLSNVAADVKHNRHLETI